MQNSLINHHKPRLRASIQTLARLRREKGKAAMIPSKAACRRKSQSFLPKLYHTKLPKFQSESLIGLDFLFNSNKAKNQYWN